MPDKLKSKILTNTPRHSFRSLSCPARLKLILGAGLHLEDNMGNIVAIANMFIVLGWIAGGVYLIINNHPFFGAFCFLGPEFTTMPLKISDKKREAK